MMKTYSRVHFFLLADIFTEKFRLLGGYKKYLKIKSFLIQWCELTAPFFPVTSLFLFTTFNK